MCFIFIIIIIIASLSFNDSDLFKLQYVTHISVFVIDGEQWCSTHAQKSEN